jgi:hypothetical protein
MPVRKSFVAVGASILSFSLDFNPQLKYNK